MDKSRQGIGGTLSWLNMTFKVSGVQRKVVSFMVFGFRYTSAVSKMTSSRKSPSRLVMGSMAGGLFCKRLIPFIVLNSLYQRSNNSSL